MLNVFQIHHSYTPVEMAECERQLAGKTRKSSVAEVVGQLWIVIQRSTVEATEQQKACFDRSLTVCSGQRSSAGVMQTRSGFAAVAGHMGSGLEPVAHLLPTGFPRKVFGSVMLSQTENGCFCHHSQCPVDSCETSRRHGNTTGL